MSAVQFTPEEEANLTPLDAAAADYMHVEALREGKIPPAWLCCSDEARSEARQNVLEMLRLKTGLHRTTLDEAAQLVERSLPASLLAAWHRAELALKQGRAEGNLHASFMG